MPAATRKNAQKTHRKPLEPAPLPDHGRLWANERGEQLIEIASELLATKGVDGVRIPDVAAVAGVTRPTVYKHFPNRQSLLIAVLERFGEELQLRFNDALSDDKPKLTEALRQIVGAVCDSLEEGGAGAWSLLSSSGPDPEVDRVVQQVRRKLIQPWLGRVSEVSGICQKDAELLCSMIVATTVAVLSRWLSHDLSREEAVEALMRGIRALLREFSK